MPDARVLVDPLLSRKTGVLSKMKQYTCTDYRMEMMLLGLKRRLAEPGLDDREIQQLQEQIRKLEAEMGMN
jgi:hypothetical protein